ncbi:endo alpha-1,4 polygalactosaminidase [Streptomyces sp. NPDC057702]|uniref:endo alpha-1,4 polygalactosaminidase n=1 Tax=unclassified Streptomyces TaxID=2593676 RepID=UPI0036C43068
MRARTPLAALTCAALLALAGCSSDDGGDDRATKTPQAKPTKRPGHEPGKQAAVAWQPKPGTTWQWQLDGRVDTGIDVPVYDIDGFENSAATVDRLHDDGRKVICYINAGAWEDWRPDADAFPKAVRGANNGWAGERWLDVRELDTLLPLMAKRMDMCRDKGFDAVEPDLMDAYRNRTGFPLTAAHQLAYNRGLAKLAHDRGLAVGLKNDLDQIPELVGDFEFAVNEECAEFGECDKLTPFIEADKAVFHVEYTLPTKKFCATAKDLGLSSMRKRLELDPWRDPC